MAKPAPGMTTTEHPQRVRKRSVIIAGHETSVSLETAFWDALKTIAARRGMSLNQIITEIDKTRKGNLSSAIRVFVLHTANERNDPAGA